jgi:hypothetical protein
MTTDDDTPAAAILGGSLASVTANVGGTPVGTSMEEEFVDNYDLTLGDNDDYTLSDKMVHYCGGQILQVHWSACKAVLAFYAGSRVSKGKTVKKHEMEKICLEIYYTAIDPCLPTLFGGTTMTLGRKFAGIFFSISPRSW